jgi:hypothetical protein
MKIMTEVTRVALYLLILWSNCVGRDSSDGIATHHELEGPGIESRRRWDFRNPSSPVLGPTLPPIYLAPSFFPELKQPERGVNHPPYLTPRHYMKFKTQVSGMNWVLKKRIIFCL